MNLDLAALASNLTSLIKLHAAGNQSAFARMMKLEQPVINRLLRQENENPTLRTLATIADSCNVTVQWLLTDHSKSQSQPISPYQALEILEVFIKPLSKLPFLHQELLKVLPSLDDPEVQNLLDTIKLTRDARAKRALKKPVEGK